MALSVKNVGKAFGGKTAVNNLSFEIDGPGVFGLLGTNGAGKTTTIRMILGILEKDAGSIEWDGAPVSRETMNFGYLPEERGLYPKIKVNVQLHYFARLRGMSRSDADKAIRYWAGRLQVEKYLSMTAEQLSKGNQQKIQLITALLHAPSLIILDEPLSGLDPVNTDLFKDVIYELIDKGHTIVMSSHQMQAVEEYCRDILILVDGETVLQGDLRQIKQGYGRNTLYLSCDREELLASLAEAQGLLLKNRTAAGFEYRINNEKQARGLLVNLLEKDVSVTRFELREPSLHEIFVEKAGARA